MRRLVVVSVGIFLVIMFLIILFVRRGDRPQQDLGINRDTNITKYADTSTTVRFTQAGQINAREDHRVLQITVGQNERTIVLFEGYQGKVLKSQTYLNDQDAYRAFLAALHNSNYTKPRIASRNIDPLGACPAGRRFSYDILDGSEIKQSLWSSSCSTKGTFAGNANMVRTLFQNQLPNYNEFIKSVDF